MRILKFMVKVVKFTAFWFLAIAFFIMALIYTTIADMWEDFDST